MLKFTLIAYGYIEYFFPKASLRRKFLKGSVFSIIGTALRQGLLLLAFILLARIIGKADFGRISIIQSTMDMIGAFSVLGLSLTVTRYLAEYRETDVFRAGCLIGIVFVICFISSLVVLLLAYVYAPLLATFFLHDPQLVVPLRIATLLLLFNSLANVQSAIAVGIESFEILAIIEGLRGFFVIPLVLLGAFFYGMIGGVYGLVANSIVGTLIGHVLLRRKLHSIGIKIQYTVAIYREARVILNFSIPLFISGIMVQPSMWIVRSFLTKLPDGYNELAVFEAAWRLESAILLIGSGVSTALLPLLVSKAGQQSAKLQIGNIVISWGVGAIPGLLLICFPEIFSMIYGESFSMKNNYNIIIILMFSFIIMMYKQGIGRVLIVESKMWWSVLSNLLWSLILIISSWFFVSQGAMGISLSFLIAYTVNLLLSLIAYSNTGIIPVSVIFTPQFFLIWIVLLVSSFLSWHGNFSFVIRLLLFFTELSVMFYSFVSYFRKKITVPG